MPSKGEDMLFAICMLAVAVYGCAERVVCRGEMLGELVGTPDVTVFGARPGLSGRIDSEDFASGGHTIGGTVVARTSIELIDAVAGNGSTTGRS